MSGDLFNMKMFLADPAKWWDNNPYELFMLWKLLNQDRSPNFSMKKLAVITGVKMGDAAKINKATINFIDQIGGDDEFLNNPPWLHSKYAMTTMTIKFIQKLYPSNCNDLYNGKITETIM